ncbi:class I SAM-dependent methyltransferase [Frankia gtarii]|uniref:class I SAM-dependent methyltransferase n=1 Tax=Frankia gtarii TaxID=2950102 RepID=UPI0021BE4FDA|nr:class I SAM-dependent methyltransferase [Frankia gtarii]
MTDEWTSQADATAVRVALWRAMHAEIDPPPHVLDDRIGLRLADPDVGWQHRPDMDPQATSRVRATVVARARFVEDLVVARAGLGVGQYVLLGAGLDTFAQRQPQIAADLRVFEVDQPGPQAWKRRRLGELGYGPPTWLRLVPIDFETGRSWWEGLVAAGFDAERPAVVAANGLSMYLTRSVNADLLRQAAALAPGSTLVMTFQLPLELVDADERPSRQATERAARTGGSPFVSFFAPSELVALALDAGFRDARHVSAGDLAARYFAGRADGLRPSSAEHLLVATT